MFNLFVLNEQEIKNQFKEVVADSDPRILRWFEKTLYRHWVTNACTNGPDPIDQKPPKTKTKLPVTEYDRTVLKYQRYLDALVKAYSCCINGTRNTDPQFSDLDERARLALTKGALLVRLAPHTESPLRTLLVHLKDFLEWQLDKDPKANLSAMVPQQLPQMIAKWGLETAEERAEEELRRSLIVQFAGQDFEFVLASSESSLIRIGNDLKNCLRTNHKRYFANNVIFGIRRISTQKFEGAMSTVLRLRPRPISGLVQTMYISEFLGPSNRAASKGVTQFVQAAVDALGYVSPELTPLVVLTSDGEEEEDDEDCDDEDDEEEDDEEEEEDEEEGWGAPSTSA